MQSTVRRLKGMQLTSVSTVVGWPWPNWASANADAQFGVINHQQAISSNHHPQHLAPLPHVTTVPTSPWSPTATAAHSCCQLPTNMAHDHQQQRGNTTSLAAMTPGPTTPNDKESPKTNANDLLTNDGQHLRTDTGDGEPRWDSLPPPHWFLWQQIQVPHHCQWRGNQMTNDDIVCHCC